MTKTIKMTRWGDKYISCTTRYSMLCGRILHLFFDFPDSQIIYIKMSDKTLPDSYRVNIFNEYENSIEIEDTSHKNISLYQSMFDEIYNNFNNGCYCQLIYET